MAKTPAALPSSHRVAGIDYGVLDDLVGYALRRAQLAIYEDFAESLGPLDITPQRFSALVVIAANPGITQAGLGAVLCIARSGVVQLIRAFDARGWVARADHTKDARAWTLTLTSEGKAHLATARRRVRAHDARVVSALSDREKKTLVALLARLGTPPRRRSRRGEDPGA